MPELDTEYKTRQQPIDVASGLAVLPPKTLARRRRLLRYGGVMAFLLSAGLSAIPGPKGSSDILKMSNENGAKVMVHQFSFSRNLGLPFAAGRAEYNDDGTIKDIQIEGPGLLGNFGVALAIVIGASIFIGRRRRDD